MQQNTSRLRRALLGNAGFSSISGLLLLLAPHAVGSWLGLSAPLILRSVGAGLVLFGGVLIHQATRNAPSGPRALVITALDGSWVVGSAVLVVAAHGWFSVTGILLVGAAAAAVAGFAAWQLSGLARLYRVPSRPEAYKVTVAVETAASPAAMWRVLADIGNVHRYLTSLRSTEVQSSGRPGVGTIRRCVSHEGARWSERFVRWDEGRGFAMEWDSTAKDFPFPFAELRGGWDIEPVPAGCIVHVWWEAIPKRAALAAVQFALMDHRLTKDMRAAIERMTQDALGLEAEVHIPGALVPKASGS